MNRAGYQGEALVSWFAAFLGALIVLGGSAHATDVGGTISATLTITEDSQLVDDVTCTVAGLPCITASGLWNKCPKTSPYSSRPCEPHLGPG